MWVLSDAAIGDLDVMVAWGARTFGYRQVEKYQSRIVDMFDTLALNPELAPQRQSAAGLVRVMPCGAHHIVYRVENEAVAILRVLHHLQGWPDEL